MECGTLSECGTSEFQSKLCKSNFRTHFQDEAYFLSQSKRQIFLPWTCCVPDYVNVASRPPRTMANKIKQRLMGKDDDDEEEEDSEGKTETERPVVVKLNTEGPYAPEVILEEGKETKPKEW